MEGDVRFHGVLRGMRRGEIRRKGPAWDGASAGRRRDMVWIFSEGGRACAGRGEVGGWHPAGEERPDRIRRQNDQTIVYLF